MIAKEIASIMESMKAKDIVLLDVGEKIKITDYFLIASGSNRRMLQAIAHEIEKGLKQTFGLRPRIEGLQIGWWILMDYGDVVVHLFQDEARSYYDLENLWADAPRVDWKMPDKDRAI